MDRARNTIHTFIATLKSENYSQCNPLCASFVNTPLGTMLAVADNQKLHVLEFIDCNKLEWELSQLCTRAKSTLVLGSTSPIASVKNELASYFASKLQLFKTPVAPSGTPFQKQAWHALSIVPYGQTISYKQQAKIIGRPTASRAVANANGANQIAILIPCHRIVSSTGKLGGYKGGIERKKALLTHERKHA